ncbi:MAG: hypothetical protein HUK22_03885 [Thermoguttaceae bacterium]|nr:hypothetical protein [Thermoguttaceae bacterium]
MATTIPVPILALGVFGAFSARRRSEAATALALSLALPIIRTIPGLPPHDGARLIIASFPFWGVLAAFGAAACVERARRAGKSAAICAGIAAACAFAVGVADVARSAPQFLSFYNATLGGVPGATRLGMEPTYYWDAFDRDVAATLERLRATAREEGRPAGVLFGAHSSQTLEYYRLFGDVSAGRVATISAPDAIQSRGDYGFYVMQRRPSGLTPLDLALIKTAKPLVRKTVAAPFNPRKKALVLEIYDFRDVERLFSADVQNR